MFNHEENIYLSTQPKGIDNFTQCTACPLALALAWIKYTILRDFSLKILRESDPPMRTETKQAKLFSQKYFSQISYQLSRDTFP